MRYKSQRWAAERLNTLWPWAVGTFKAFVQGLVSTLDDDEENTRDGFNMRYPDTGEVRRVSAENGWKVVPSEGDAERLRLLSRTFDVRRYSTDTDASFLLRLGKAWESHENGGTVANLITELHAFGWPDVRVYNEGDHQIAAENPNWFQWSYIVVLGPDMGPFTADLPKLGSVALDGRAQLGTGKMSSALIEETLQIIERERSAFVSPAALIFDFYGDAFPGAIVTPNTFVAGVARIQIRERRALGCGARIGMTIG